MLLQAYSVTEGFVTYFTPVWTKLSSMGPAHMNFKSVDGIKVLFTLRASKSFMWMICWTVAYITSAGDFTAAVTYKAVPIIIFIFVVVVIVVVVVVDSVYQ